MTFRVVIPARYASSRLPGKPLLEVAGRSLIEHAWHCARNAGADEVHVATDDARIFEHARGFGALAHMTATTHSTGSDRIAELSDRLGWDDRDIVVNLQADEPLLPPVLLAQVASVLEEDTGADIATLSTPIMEHDDFVDPNVVKVVCDQTGRALYFSRAPIPFSRDTGNRVADDAKRHLGIYAYRVDALKKLAGSPECAPERIERLEQLRALWIGQGIAVRTAVELPGPGIDTPEDLERVTRLMETKA